MNHMFRQFGAVLFAAAIIFGIPPASSQDTSSVDALRKIYDTSQQKLGEDRTATLRGLLDQYGKSLDQLIRQLQSQGELELLLAVKKEKDRFDGAQTVPAEPLPGASPYVIKLQDDYRKAGAQAALQHNKAIVDLADKYIARLEAAKKDLTIKGRIPEALATKKEADRVLGSAPVTAARFALLDHQTATQPAPPVPAVTPPPPDSGSTVACPGCGGSGKAGAPCIRCNGTGRCPNCNGRGQRPSGFKGSHGTVGCISCSASGLCRACNGTGKDLKTCTQCDGSGKVPASSPPPTVAPGAYRPPPSVSAPVATPPPSAAERVSREKAEAELRAYSDRLASMKQQFQSGKTRSVTFEDVTENPDKYAGELLASDVHLVDGRPRQIRVASTLDDAKVGGRTLVPASAEVGEKASKLAWSIKRTDKIVIIYGVVNKDNFTVFDLRQK